MDSSLGLMIACIDIDLGLLVVSGNAFTDGSAMPSRTIPGGASAQLASIIPVVQVSAAMTATAPVLTTTYVNQAGTGSRTCTMTLPNNCALDSCFLMAPHLQSGDMGIQDVTNISISTGSAGSLHVRGLLPVGIMGNPGAAPVPYSFIANPVIPFPIQAGDVIGFYKTNQTGASAGIASFSLVAET